MISCLDEAGRAPGKWDGKTAAIEQWCSEGTSAPDLPADFAELNSMCTPMTSRATTWQSIYRAWILLALTAHPLGADMTHRAQLGSCPACRCSSEEGLHHDQSFQVPNSLAAKMSENAVPEPSNHDGLIVPALPRSGEDHVRPVPQEGKGHAEAVAGLEGHLSIMPLGDSITRGSYLVRYPSGPRQGQAISLPNPAGGGWRKPLQDRLRVAGVRYNFVGDLTYNSYGMDGVRDPDFDPDHHGLAGFSNRQIMSGGVVPTLPDALDALGVDEVVVPDLVTVLHKHKPDVILLMAGTNGFDAQGRDELIRLIGTTCKAHLFVATIPPQRPPRPGSNLSPKRYTTLMQRMAWQKVDDYNASLPIIVAAQVASGHQITLVDIHDAINPDEDLEPDGVHPNLRGMEKMASAWFEALAAEGFISGEPLQSKASSGHY